MEAASDQEQGGSGKTTSYLCRQSSTRWTPTSDQIRILKDLYYNNGVRSPSAEQIQRISAKLRQYGKIEGKNVFYWFQNHKARERQKKRFTADHMHSPLHDHHIYNTFSNINPTAPGSFAAAASSSTAAGLVNVGSYGYGSVAMEQSFRACSLTPSANVGGQNFSWIGVDSYSSSTVYPLVEIERKRCMSKNGHETLEEEEMMETLPLFPMQGGEFKQQQQQEDNQGWQHYGGGDSLELTLTSGFNL